MDHGEPDPTSAEPTTDGPRQPVDYRFLLANERTYLAYLRTSLSLQVAGLAVLQFLTQAHSSLRYALGIVLVAVGSLMALIGMLRHRSNEQAIRAGRELVPPRATVGIALAIVGVPLLAALLIAI
jgi:putative membrane protein